MEEQQQDSQQQQRGEMRKVIVIRHGERIDETDPSYWFNHCKATYDPKINRMGYESRLSDPYLTENGNQQAQEVTNTLLKELSSYEINEITSIYSSKLIRSIQTAYSIAKKIHKPIILCKGFAMTAAAVESIGDEFQYLSLQEIQELCPGVELIDGDVDEMIPSQSWLHPFHYVVRNHEVSLVVAHRESIRNLAQRRLRTPYCCYGVFHVPQHARILETIELKRLVHRDGNDIDF